jgi:hypothetical protein
MDHGIDAARNDGFSSSVANLISLVWLSNHALFWTPKSQTDPLPHIL